MSLALIEELSAATGRLRAAMQQADLGNMETALTQFRASLEAVQAIGAWRADPQAKAVIEALGNELECSRMLACLLGDVTGQMHAAFAARNIDAPQPLYSAAR